MKTFQVFIDDTGISGDQSQSLLNTGGKLRHLSDNTLFGELSGPASNDTIGSAIRNRVFSSLRNPSRADGVALILLRPSTGTIYNSADNKVSWLPASKMAKANEEASSGTLDRDTIPGVISGAFPNSKTGEYPVQVVNTVYSPKVIDSFSAYRDNEKRLYVAALVISVAADGEATCIPTPTTNVYEYKGNEYVTGDSNNGTSKPWNFPTEKLADGVTSISFSMDLPLGAQILSQADKSNPSVRSNYVVVSDSVSQEIKNKVNSQIVIYVPYDSLADQTGANVGPISFVKDGELLQVLVNANKGTGSQIGKDNMIVVASGDTITTTNMNDLERGKPSVTIPRRYANNSGEELLSVGLAAVAGLVGARALTKNKPEKSADVSKTNVNEEDSDSTRGRAFSER